MAHVNERELAKKFGGVPERSRRERKKPQFFTCEREEKPVVEVAKGEGTELKAIGNVAYRMSKMKAEDDVVTFLHRVIFKRAGKGSTRKKAILSFSGFAFPEATETSELEKIKEKTSQQQVKVLNAIITLFDLPKGLKDKADKVQSIVDFLKCPAVLSDVDASQQVKRKRKAPATKRKSRTKRKAEDSPEEEEAEAGGTKEAKPEPRKRVRRSRKVEAKAPADDDAVMEEAPQESPESDDPAPKAEENESDSKPENVDGAKEDVDEMDSEEEGENNANQKDDQEGEDNKNDEDSGREVAKQETEAVGADAHSTENAVTNEGEAEDNNEAKED